MRVVVNSLAAMRARTGVGCYVVNLLANLQRIAQPESIHDFPTGRLRWFAQSSAEWFAGKQRPPAGAASTHAGPGLRQRVALGLRAMKRVCMERLFRWSCPASKFTLYHEPNFIPWQTDLPTVITVLDLSVMRHPEWHPADRVAYHEKHFRRGLDQGHHFVAISEFTRRELVDFAGVSPERVSTTYMGVGPAYRPLSAMEVQPVLARHDLAPGYLLVVGTLEPRKNLRMLLEAYVSLPAPVRERHPLVLAGGWGWNCQAIADYYHLTARHANVRHLGYVPDDDLPALYNGATALLYPSHYEGFGLPPLEMLACGGATLASSCDSLREVLAGYPLFEPTDADAWRNAMYRVCTDRAFAAQLRAGAIERAASFTWDRCARETLDVYDRLAKAA